MPRAHFTKVVALRPADGEALPRHYAWPDGLERGEELPLPLLELASYLKFCSPCRVDLIDLRAPVGSPALELRRQLSIAAPDVVLIQVEAANLRAALAAARAARDSGAELVLATGALVRTCPAEICAGTEWDGYVAGSPAPLVEALARLQNGASAGDVLDHLRRPAEARSDWHPDRKLVDYGRYLSRGQPSSPLRTSHHWEVDHPRSLDDLEAEILECESLGISQLQLVGPLESKRALELLQRLEQRRAEVSLVVPVGEEGVELMASAPATLGGVHLGRVHSAAWGPLLDRVATTRRVLPGVRLVAELCLDDLDPGRLAQLKRLSGAGLAAELSLGLQPLSHPGWSSFLRSPSRSFRPPLLVPDERSAHQLLREGRELFGEVAWRPSLRRRALDRLAKILRA